MKKEMRIKQMHYTEFRELVKDLLREFDNYCSLPNTAPYIDIEDSIDNLMILLMKKVPKKKKKQLCH